MGGLDIYFFSLGSQEILINGSLYCIVFLRKKQQSMLVRVNACSHVWYHYQMLFYLCLVLRAYFSASHFCKFNSSSSSILSKSGRSRPFCGSSNSNAIASGTGILDKSF